MKRASKEGIVDSEQAPIVPLAPTALAASSSMKMENAPTSTDKMEPVEGSPKLVEEYPEAPDSESDFTTEDSDQEDDEDYKKGMSFCLLRK
jgi:hypothetical protein